MGHIVQMCTEALNFILSIYLQQKKEHLHDQRFTVRLYYIAYNSNIRSPWLKIYKLDVFFYFSTVKQHLIKAKSSHIRY